ncbi:MAG: cadmium-translocating P-type ATPase [Bacillota bacterium]|nr:MAG: cadmium-translocating P-type ATPase [Bacillota bacterium]
MSENKKLFLRILVAAALYAAALAVYFTVELPYYGQILIFAAVYLVIGWDVLFRAARNIVRGQVFDENFLMALATLGAFVIGELPETVAVMLFYQVGELFQSYAVGKSRASISSLMEIRPDKAVVLRGNTETEVSPEEVEIGETILVKAGEKIPLDGVVTEGESYLDTSALTGESVPRACRAGDEVLSGCINTGGVLKIRSEKEFYDSTVNKILDLVENVAGKKARAENFITRFAKYYTPVVVGLALLLFLLPSLVTGEWAEWGGRALNFLVVSCPCALVISVPMSFFGGLGGASKNGVLVKGGAYMEKLAETGVMVFDKTGTLTKGKFAVKGVYPENRAEEILAAAAICEKNSTHPIALSIMEKCPFSPLDGWSVREVSGMGIIAEKGREKLLCGNGKLLRKENVNFEEITNENTIVYVARNGEYFGRIEIGDEIKEEAKEVISALNGAGIKTVMLTGDNERVARLTAEKIGVKEYRANLLPADKVAAVEDLMKTENKALAFVGDGINDAPVLMRVDVGVSMGAIGSDSAIEASDVVLMKDDLRAIPQTKRIAKKTMRVVKQNIVFALAVKSAILLLSALGITGLWLAVFADVGVAVLAVLNAMRTLKGAE